MMVEKSGLLVVLVESSSVMQRDMVLTQPSGMSQHIPRGDLVVAAISRFLQNLGDQADVGVVVGGYSIDDNGHAHLTSRSGDETPNFAAERLSAVISAPLDVKTVKRNSPNGTVSQQVPVHLRLGLSNAKASQAQAFAAAQHVLSRTNPSEAIIINICCSESAGANPQQIIEQIMQGCSGKTQVVNIHLGMGSDVAIKYPSRKLALRGIARQLFSRTSDLTPGLVKSLKELKQNTLAGAKSLIVNGSMVDLSELLTAVRNDVVASWTDGSVAFDSPAVIPAPAPQTDDPSPNVVPASSDETQTEDSAVELAPSPADDLPADSSTGTDVMFVLGTGVADPYSDESGTAVRKLLDIANETIESSRDLDATLSFMSVTKDSDGDVEVTNSFPGDSGKGFAVKASGISEVAVDSIDAIESISDGAGGLIDIPRKKLIFVRAEPTVECGFSEFVPHIAEAIHRRNAAVKILVLFFAGPPSNDDLLAIESLKIDYKVTIIGCVQTVVAHAPLGVPQKDISRINIPELVRLAECCQVTLNDAAPVFALNINSGRGLLKVLQEVALAGV